MKKMVYVGLPCYNEEDNINVLIDNILKVGKQIKKEFGYDLTILCVNDGSSDNTEKIISKRKEKNVLLINHPKNMGLGKAMKTILFEFNKEASKEDLLITMDADNTHNPKYILDLIKKYETNFLSVVIASRYQKGAQISGLKKHRILMSDLAKVWYSLMLRIPKVKDYTCGYRLYTYDIVNDGINKFGDNIITKTSFACMMELLYKLHLSGAKIGEVPFSLEYEKKKGSSKMKIFRTTKDSLITTIKIKNENSTKEYLPYILIFLITIGFLLISSSTLINVGLTGDTPVYLNVAKGILNGKVPYKDMFDNKGPILYLMNALFLKIGGHYGLAVLEFILLFTTFTFIYKTLKLINKKKIQRLVILIFSASCLLNFFTYGLSCEEYALCFSSIALYECIKYYKNDSFTNLQCILLGFLGALCFFIRQNLIVVFLGFGIGIFIKHLIEKRYKEVFKYILFAFIGFLIGAIPILIYLLINNCFKEYIDLTFILNMSTNKMGIRLSLIYMARQLGIMFRVLILYLLILIVIIFKNKDFKSISILVTLIMTILLNIIGATVDFHYYIMFIPLLVLLCSDLFNIFCNYKSTVLIIYLLIFVMIGVNIWIARYDFQLPQPHQDIIDCVKNNTDSNDKIAVLGFNDEIYYLSDREPVSRYTYVLSNRAFNDKKQIEIITEYIKDIMEKKPKIIVENDEMVVFGIQKYISLIDYDEFVANNYIIAATEPVVYQAKIWNKDDNDWIVQDMAGFVKVFRLKEDD